MNGHQFERGFKSWCEKTALALRKSLNLSPTDSLSPYKLAFDMGVKVLFLDDLSVSDECKAHLRTTGSSEWSALAVTFNSKTAILLNDTHPDGRMTNSLMHELSHVILQHEPSTVSIVSDNMTLRTYDKKKEAEADWLAATLLLPKDVLEFIARKRDPHWAQDHYSVSGQLITYRMNMTGIGKRFHFR